jgi:hypothetical protein
VTEDSFGLEEEAVELEEAAGGETLLTAASR